MASTSPKSRWLHDYTTAFFLATFAIASHSVTAAVSSSDNIDDEYHEVHQFSHFNEPFDERVFGKLKLEMLDVTPSSIEVKWFLTNRSLSDSVVEFTFLLETVNVRIVSDKLHSNTDSFRFEFLSPNTRYLICAHLLEKDIARNASVLHYNCQTFSTIPVLRLDSILGVLLTAAYFVLVLILGFLAWLRRVRKYKESNEEKEEEETLKVEEEMLKVEEDDEEKEDDYFQFVKAAGRGGFSNYATGDDYRQDEISGVNGGSGYKTKGSRGDCTGACIPFTTKEEENLVEYNAKMREISF